MTSQMTARARAAGLIVCSIALSAAPIAPARAEVPTRYSAAGPTRWMGGPIPYEVESIREAELVGLTAVSFRQAVEAAFKKWRDVPTAEFAMAPSSSPGIIATYEKLIEESNRVKKGILVVSDHNGAITRGLSEATGFPAPTAPAFTYPFRDEQGEYLIMWVVIRRKTNDFASVLQHEAGHALGLHHSQIGEVEALAPVLGGGTVRSQMHPTRSTSDLAPDDRAWISRLYPRRSLFSQTYVLLTSEIRVGGKGLCGVHVRAIQTLDANGRKPLAPQQFGAISGGTMPFRNVDTNQGQYELVVPRGTYDLIVEQVMPAPTPGAAVGAFAARDVRPLIPVQQVRRIEVSGESAPVIPVLEISKFTFQTQTCMEGNSKN